MYGEKIAFLEYNFVPVEELPKATGSLYIFDYNKDTRMYVFDNIIKDKAVVVYVPHEQDY